MAIDETVYSNLEVMLSEREGGMADLFQKESFGGNAGSYKGFSCVALNFYFDNMGRMLYFGNIQNVPQRIIQSGFLATLKIAMDFTTGDTKIVDVLFYDAHPFILSNGKETIQAGGVPNEARDVLNRTLSEYNSLYGKNDLVKTIFDRE